MGQRQGEAIPSRGITIILKDRIDINLKRAFRKISTKPYSEKHRKVKFRKMRRQSLANLTLVCFLRGSGANRIRYVQGIRINNAVYRQTLEESIIKKC